MFLPVGLPALYHEGGRQSILIFPAIDQYFLSMKRGATGSGACLSACELLSQEIGKFFDVVIRFLLLPERLAREQLDA